MIQKIHRGQQFDLDFAKRRDSWEEKTNGFPRDQITANLKPCFSYFLVYLKIFYVL